MVHGRVICPLCQTLCLTALFRQWNWLYPFIAWKNGRMVFENERLEKIMAELQRWYDFELFYADPDVKEMHFTIDILKYEEISKVLNLMERMNKVKFTQKGRTVVVNSY